MRSISLMPNNPIFLIFFFLLINKINFVSFSPCSSLRYIYINRIIFIMTNISIILFGVLEKKKHLLIFVVYFYLSIQKFNATRQQSHTEAAPVVNLFYHVNYIWYDLSVTW